MMDAAPGPGGQLSWIMQLGQLTASGAITVMFGWMLFQAAKHFREERKSREKVAENYRRAASRYRKAASLLADAHKEASANSTNAVIEAGKEREQYEREACERRQKDLLERLEKRHEEAARERAESHKIIREIKHTVANLAQSEANRRALEELQKQKGAGKGAGEIPGGGKP